MSFLPPEVSVSKQWKQMMYFHDVMNQRGIIWLFISHHCWLASFDTVWNGFGWYYRWDPQRYSVCTLSNPILIPAFLCAHQLLACQRIWCWLQKTPPVLASAGQQTTGLLLTLWAHQGKVVYASVAPVETAVTSVTFPAVPPTKLVS